MQAPQVAAELRDLVPEKCIYETDTLLSYSTQPN